MKPTQNEPLALDLLLSKDQRRLSSNERQIAFKESIATPSRAFDAVDLEVDDDYHVVLDGDMIEVPWPEINPPSRRKDSEVNRVLSILDNLPTGKESE